MSQTGLVAWIILAFLLLTPSPTDPMKRTFTRPGKESAMSRRITTLVVLALVCASSGCGVGTFMNLQPPRATGIGLDEGKARRPYGGVLFDAETMASLSGKEMLLVALLGLDLPISAVLDTVTLPATVYWTTERWGNALHKDIPKPPADAPPIDQPTIPPGPAPGS
jgi:uncharacterized protein YceK